MPAKTTTPAPAPDNIDQLYPPQQVAPTPTPTPEYQYQVDQQASVNAFFDVGIGSEYVRLQITARYGSTPEKIAKTTEALISAYSLLRAAHPLLDVAPKPAATTANANASQTALQPIGAPEPKKSYTNSPVPAHELPEGLPEGGEFYKQDFDFFIIEPQPDDKATVKFYKDGLEFPVGAQINKYKNNSVFEALHLLGSYDVTKAQKVRVAGMQYWYKGNEYTISKGAHAGEKSHYKNLSLLLPTL
jgi:hypothetical protein